MTPRCAEYELYEAVIRAIAEVTDKSERIVPQYARVTLGTDRDGSWVIIPMLAPEGWFHHTSTALRRHGVVCQHYA